MLSLSLSATVRVRVCSCENGVLILTVISRVFAPPEGSSVTVVAVSAKPMVLSLGEMVRTRALAEVFIE